MTSSPSVAFHTLGCKLNFAESSTIARQLRDHGFRRTTFDASADVYIINTCSVTENADRECRAIVRKALKQNPDAFVAVIGCYAQLKPEEIAAIEGVDLVLGASEKFNLPRYLREIEKRNRTEIHSCEVDAAGDFISSYSMDDRTRAFLKIQDGCDYSCSFCTIPLARGSSRSDTIEQVLIQANAIAAAGHREIVLTGVNIGDFGSGSAENFLSLIKELDQVDGIDRFRISSIEPNLLTDEIIEFVASSKRFVPHFHIPLQSGSDKVLKMMRRRYLHEVYCQRVQKIKSLMPHCCIGVDVIVGFPGEGEDEFLETYRLLSELDISYLHVFTYSERDHTHALQLPDQVAMEVRKRRNKMLRNLSQKKLHHFYSSHLGEKHRVLFETESKDGLLYGFTDNYIKVNIPFDPLLAGQVVEVVLDKIGPVMDVSSNLAVPVLA